MKTGEDFIITVTGYRGFGMSAMAICISEYVDKLLLG